MTMKFGILNENPKMSSVSRICLMLLLIVIIISFSESSVLKFDRLSATKNRLELVLLRDSKGISRHRRSVGSLGETAVAFLLKGATHLYSTSVARVFVKYGGYIRAIEDFKAIQPTNAKVVRIKGEVIQEGRVGDRTVFLGKGGVSYDNFPAIVVTKQSIPGSHRRPVYIIYKK